MDKLRVRLVDFDPQKIAEVHRHLSAALEEIERLVGRRVNFPPLVKPMTAKEMTLAGRVNVSATGDAGHGVWDRSKNEVRVGPFLSSQDMLTSVVTSLARAALPDAPEEASSSVAKQVMGKLNLVEQPNSLFKRISEGLSRKTIKNLRKLDKKNKSQTSHNYFPGLMGNDITPFSVTGSLPGPPGFGPVSVGGIIRHS